VDYGGNMKKLVLAMVALLAVFTFIREYVGEASAAAHDLEKAQASAIVTEPSPKGRD